MNHPSAADDHAGLHLRAVERVQHGPYQLRGRARQQPGVGIEREDIFHPAQRRGVAGDDGKLALQALRQRRERHYGASLALARHIPAVPLGINPRAAEQVKAAGVFFVQFIEGLLRRGDARGVLRHVSLAGLRQVGQEGEEQIFPALARGVAVFLYFPGNFPAGSLAGEQRGHGADGQPLLRHAAG